MPPELLGPLGLTVALAIGLAALWRDHQRADADDRAVRDRAFAAGEAATKATADLAISTKLLADAAEKRWRADDRARKP